MAKWLGLDLKCDNHVFKSYSNHVLDLFQVVIGSTSQMHWYMAS